ncbi:MAG: CDP-alcohol phosphatidyltransferase family protein [Gemmatimonadetes bacterium]|nr:CDP-alcohol phosphatidyltransferase family protein [Gemmatimonadota bacterium]
MQRSLDAVLAPLARSLGASGVSPNAITTVGTLVLVGSGVAFAAAQVRLGALLLLLSGVCDMLDGKVARSNGLVTQFGAFYDSTLDRIGEAALFLGIAWYFVSGGVTGGLAPLAMAMTFIAAGAGIIVSYARARADGLGLDCKVGIAQRAERIVGLGGPTLFFSAGPRGYLLLTLVSALAVLNVITVIQRIVHVYRITREARPEASRRATPALTDPVGKGRRGT